MFLLAAVAFLLSSQRFGVAQNQVIDLVENQNRAVSIQSDLERFNLAVQKRFLTEPSFGMSRIAQTLSHMRGFHPNGEEESALVKGFNDNGWKIGIYLYGRTALPRESKNNSQRKFDIKYRVNQPVPVTWGLKEKELPNAKKLMPEVKEAFLNFQTNKNPDEGNLQFTKGNWTFLAKPVRAMNDSCIRCHTDYVITEKLGDGKFKLRKRAVGDVNGIVVYGYSKHKIK